jgi:hypothetical protein
MPGLEPKLTGRTPLKRSEATRLLVLFLTYWRFDESAGQYQPFRGGDLVSLAGRLVDELYPAGESRIRLRESDSATAAGISESASGTGSSTAQAQLRASDEVMTEVFRQSDAHITISRDRSVIGDDLDKAANEFRELMRRLREIDRADGRQRALIWIVDIGLRNDQLDAIRAFINVEWLTTLFRSFALVDRRRYRATLEWLEQRVLLLVGGLTSQEIDICYGGHGIEVAKHPSDLPWFDGRQLTFEFVPTPWLKVDLGAFGSDLQAIWSDRTITADLNLAEWDLHHPVHVDRRKDLRYFLHRNQDGRPHCLELRQPGYRASDDLRLVSEVAFRRLGLPQQAIKIDLPDALALLQQAKFAAFTLSEFYDMSNRIAAAARG